MYLADALILDAPRRTKDGFLAVRARAARSGVYDYAGIEVDPQNAHGLRDKATVKVYRPGDEVFDRASLGSFIGKPITNDHPATPVTAANWRDHARGTIMGAIRDGEYVAFDLLLTDKAAIDAVSSGKRELSNGYATDLKFEPGKAPDGTAYDAVQTSIQGNHIALVDRGRAGPECRIADRFAVCDANPAAVAELTKEHAMKIKIGDAEVDATNGEAVRIAVDALNVRLNALTADKVAADAKAVTDAATITARDATITDLEAKLADAAITPAKLADAAKAFADVQAKAKAAGVTVADDADTAAIMKAVVDAKMGEAANDYTADHVAIAFAALTRDAAATVHNLDAKPATIADSRAVITTLRTARYA